jgi:hypothetical protein
MVSSPVMIGESTDAAAPVRDVPVDAPVPAPVPDAAQRAVRPDPTRYGDWERNGRCIDF